MPYWIKRNEGVGDQDTSITCSRCGFIIPPPLPNPWPSQCPGCFGDMDTTVHETSPTRITEPVPVPC